MEPVTEAVGFILQPTYRIEGGRAVVHLFGCLDSGEPFLVRDDREVPHFFIRGEDGPAAARLGARPLAPTGKVNPRGEPLLRAEVAVPPDTPAIRDRLVGAGIPCFEADVRFALRYLIDRGIKSSLRIRGPARRIEDGTLLFDNPELAPACFRPRLSVLSFDIETDPRARRLLSIALYGRGRGGEVAEVLLFAPQDWSCPETATCLRSEAELLATFCARVRHIDPDVLTGWNVVDFDLTVLERLGQRWGVPLDLGRLEPGRGPGRLRLLPSRSPRRTSDAQIPGRLVLDGIELLRGAFVRMDEYSLDFVAREVLGEGKTVGGHGRAGEILRLFKEDRPQLVEYNLTDARLALEVLEKLRLVELAVERSLLTGISPNRVAASIACFDFLYLSELAKRDVAAPSVGGDVTDSSLATYGGHVLEPVTGLHENVLVFDFKSLYPSLIRTFQIDPLGYLHTPGLDDDPIMAPNGAAFRREPGILTHLLDDLLPRRDEAKRQGDKVASGAIKILMNSFYGVLGTPACRFYNPLIAGAITSFGKQMLLWTKARAEKYGHPVVYGDTDSLFILSGETDPEAARRLGEDLAGRLNRDLAAHITQVYRVESRLELEFERLYLKLHLMPVRRGKGGARKRYVGLVEAEDGGTRVVFTGMESVRRDSTDLAKQVQRELYERFFAGQPLEEFLRRTVEELRGGQLDGLLVYKKALRKPPEAYTSTTPPHVAAARKMKVPPRRGLIAYRMTTVGPEPLEDGVAPSPAPLDYEHYVDKQVRPVAEPVLELAGLTFDAAVGDADQLVLF